MNSPIEKNLRTNNSFKCLVTLSNFVEKCLEDILETHLRNFTYQSNRGTLLTDIVYELEFPLLSYQDKFIKLC